MATEVTENTEVKLSFWRAGSRNPDVGRDKVVSFPKKYACNASLIQAYDCHCERSAALIATGSQLNVRSTAPWAKYKDVFCNPCIESNDLPNMDCFTFVRNDGFTSVFSVTSVAD